jgi:hypothetical protein
VALEAINKEFDKVLQAISLSPRFPLACLR